MAETVDSSKKANEFEHKEEKLVSMEMNTRLEFAQKDDLQEENRGIDYYIL